MAQTALFPCLVPWGSFLGVLFGSTGVLQFTSKSVLKSLARRQRRSIVGSTGRFKLKSSTTAANNAMKSMMLNGVLQNLNSLSQFCIWAEARDVSVCGGRRPPFPEPSARRRHTRRTISVVKAIRNALRKNSASRCNMVQSISHSLSGWIQHLFSWKVSE